MCAVAVSCAALSCRAMILPCCYRTFLVLRPRHKLLHDLRIPRPANRPLHSKPGVIPVRRHPWRRFVYRCHCRSICPKPPFFVAKCGFALFLSCFPPENFMEVVPRNAMTILLQGYIVGTCFDPLFVLGPGIRRRLTNSLGGRITATDRDVNVHPSCVAQDLSLHTGSAT